MIIQYPSLTSPVLTGQTENQQQHKKRNKAMVKITVVCVYSRQQSLQAHPQWSVPKYTHTTDNMKLLLTQTSSTTR